MAVAVVFDEDSEMEGSSGDECQRQEQRILFPPNNAIDAYDYLSTAWTDINPSVKESTIQGKVVVVVYYDEK